MSELERRIADVKRVVSQWPMASYKVDALVRAAKAEAWDEALAAVFNPESREDNPYRWGGEQ